MAASRQPPLKGKGVEYAQMYAQDVPHKEILEKLCGIGPDSTDKEKNKAEQQLWRWRHHPDFYSYFNAEIDRILNAAANEAISVIKNQLKDKSQPWLQNKAANDLMNHRKTALQKDENQITVKVEGMPTLGTPDMD
jgi:hypothetical protein